MAIHTTTNNTSIKEYKANALTNEFKNATVIFNGKKYYNCDAKITDNLTVDYIEVSHGSVYIYAKDN